MIEKKNVDAIDIKKPGKTRTAQTEKILNFRRSGFKLGFSLLEIVECYTIQ